MQGSGAETYRVEETVTRILETAGLARAECFAMSTGVMATLDDPAIRPITVVRRVTKRENNLGRIHRCNSVSRDFCSGAISLDEAYDLLTEIRDTEPYPSWLLYLCRFIAVLTFAMVFGGSVREVAGAALVCPFLLIAILAGEVLHLHSVIRTILTAFAAGIGASLMAALLPQADEGLVIISCIMLLVPGAPFTNAIRDILYGDYSSGTSRIMESILIATSVAMGIILAYAVRGGAL